MTGIANNPARVALLTEMAEQTDGGAKVWEAQPATRNGTKNALLRDGYVSIAKGGKASITGKGREAVTSHTLKAMTAPVALAAPEAPAAKGDAGEIISFTKGPIPAKGDEAKAKFEAARAEVVKPAKAAEPENQEPAGKVRAAQKAVAQYDAKQAKAEKTKRAAAAAKKPEAKTEPAAEAPKGEWQQVREQLAAVPSKVEQIASKQAAPPAPVTPTEEGKAKVEAPAKWVMTKRTEAGWQPSAKDKLSAIIQDVYGVNYYHAPAIALIWAASQFADLEGIEAAREALTEINREREEAGKPIAVPPYGSKLF